MQWPEKPTCHKNEQHIPSMKEDTWRPPEDTPNGRPYRSCSYCGSIHPEDLIKFLDSGGTIEQADWKYGWPHKFYINNVPNPRAGEECSVGKTNDEHGKTIDIMGSASKNLWIKWYNTHLTDDGYDDETLELLLLKIRVPGLTFARHPTNRRVYWARTPTSHVTAEEKNNDEPKPN